MATALLHNLNAWATLTSTGVAAAAAYLGHRPANTAHHCSLRLTLCHLQFTDESIQAQGCCHLSKSGRASVRTLHLIPKPRLCYEFITNGASFSSNSTPILGAGDHFSRLKGGGRSLPPKGRVPAASGRCRAWRVHGAGRRRYLLTDVGPHICLSLKPRWIGFLDVYLSLRSSALGPRRAQLRTPA